MARTYGRLFGSMWASDDDFLELGSDAMFVYMFLVSQLDLGQSGIITLRIAPWSRLMKKTVPEVEAALKELAAERFVVIDDDEMLLLVRSLIRRDQIHQQPNVFKSAVEQVYATRSMPIRRALLAELERLPDDELKGDSKKVRADVVAWLKKACANPSPKPPGKGSPKGSPKGSDDHGRNPAPENAQIGQDFAEGADEEGCVNPSVNPSYARAHARDALPLSQPHTQPPTPTPSARQIPVPSALPLFEAAPTARDEEPPEETLNADIPVVSRIAAQGDVLIQRQDGRAAASKPVPQAGFPVISAGNGGHTHALYGPVFYAPSTTAGTDPSDLELGTLTVPKGVRGLLSHPEHGALLVDPGTYVVKRQREQADVLKPRDTWPGMPARSPPINPPD